MPMPAGTLLKPCHPVNYDLNQREGLSVYLNDGDAALTNNICERAIRSFTVGRKNWLFSASPKGTTASAAVYSMIETCKANSIDPFKYLVYLFERMPNTNFKLHPDELDALLP